MPLSERQRVALARDLQRAVARAAPDWTGSGAHDPGITLLELLAFLVDDLHHRRTALSPHARLLASDLARRASALAATSDAGDCEPGLRRVNYFAGELLGVDDFQTEQQYVRDRLSRRNRLLYGAGIVGGLEVAVGTDASGAHVTVAPGLAFAPDGSEIFLDTPCVLALPASGANAYVQIAYREAPCRNVVVAEASQPSRIVETSAVSLAATPDATAVTLAHVRFQRGRWRIDARFVPVRLCPG
jgi:hypothetical protein